MPKPDDQLLPTESYDSGPGRKAKDASKSPGPEAYPGFELKGELGHGGMGTVFLARERTAARDVALKVLAARWRRDYNQVRPHSSLGYRPPAPEAREGLPALSATLRSQAIPLRGK